jgi:glyoxylase-like metal-dependent hydrolase (beta-lactamase superfamily II)
MKAVGLHPDVIVVTSRFWQTTCTLVRAGEEAFCIDSPVLPDELELLPAIAQQADFRVVGCLATHVDWDHVLGRYAFADAPLGVAESSAARLRNEPGAAQRELRDKDDELYVERPAPLALGEVQTLPVPGSIELGPEELELHPADGHTSDGMAVMARWCGLLCVGDYLSKVEIPMVESGLGDYRATLARLAPLVEAADTVVPGHGMPSTRDEALRILDEDVDYLDTLERGEEKPRLPKGRDSREQRKIHAENLARV